MLIATAAGTAVAGPTRTFTEEVDPGITHEIWEETGIVRINLVRVDLTSQEVGLVATNEGDKGITTGTFANRYGAEVAINANAFRVSDFRPYGFALGATGQWSNTADDATTALMHARFGVQDNGERNFAELQPPEMVSARPDLPLDVLAAVSGKLLLRAGAVETPPCEDPIALACQAAPRTAVAISSDGRTMLMAVVDGWQAGSEGMTAAELATFLRARGAYLAMQLDSGSSSTMVIKGQLANAPSDTVQRRVANHLGITYQDRANGSMAGRICTPDLTACQGGDPSGYLPGAKVVLDDGRKVTVGSDAFYTFSPVAPREACITVSLDGYKTRKQCVQIKSGLTPPTFNSVVLEPGMDPPPADAPIDASEEPPPDGPGSNPDNGDGGIVPPPPGSDGCCDAGHGPPPIVLVLAVWVLVRRKRHAGPFQPRDKAWYKDLK
jgi:exopolysaccharide biosynthesis protein